MRLIRKRLAIANSNYSEDQTLTASFHRILQRLSKVKSISLLQKDIETLDRYAELSREICLHINENEWVIGTLINAIGSLNRSEPHKVTLYSILGVMNSLLRNTGTEVFYGREDLLNIIVKNFRNFHSKDAKNNLIITRSITLLSLLLKDKVTLKVSLNCVNQTGYLLILFFYQF